MADFGIDLHFFSILACQGRKPDLENRRDGYLLRSSSMIFALSLALGILAQTPFIEANIRVFFAAAMRGAIAGRSWWTEIFLM
jgi:hypothetical protein